MADPRALKSMAFKLAGLLAAAWAAYWLHGTAPDMAAWFAQGEYGDVVFTVLIGMVPLAGWLHTAFGAARPKAEGGEGTP